VQIRAAACGAWIAEEVGMKQCAFVLGVLGGFALVGGLGCSSGSGNRSTGESDAATSSGDDAATGPFGHDGATGPMGAGDGGSVVTGDASAPPNDGGQPGDAGAPPSGGTGVFADAGAYVPMLGPSASNARHTPNPNPAGTPCLSCHGGQKGNVVQFLFGGTVWSSPAATTPTPMAEVRVVQADGVALTAYSDADGNYFFPQGANGPLSAPAAAGIRDAKGEASMANVFNDGDCNSCHRQGGQAPVNLP
jgi:hypothetical protein